MDKRLLIALPLCLAIFIGWQFLAAKMGWMKPPQHASETAKPVATSSSDAVSKPPAAATSASTEPDRGARIGESAERVETFVVGEPGRPGHYQATFTNKGGALAQLRSANYVDHAGLTPEERADPAHWRVLVGDENGPSGSRSFLLRTSMSSAGLAREPLENALWKMERDGNVVTFTLATGSGVTFTKRFTFESGSDRIRFELGVANGQWTDTGGYKNFVLTPASGVPHDSGDTFYREPQSIAVAQRPSDSKPTVAAQLPSPSGDPKSGSLVSNAPILFAGSFNKYFALLLTPSDAESRTAIASASWRAVRDEAWLAKNPGLEGESWRRLETDLDLQLALPEPGASRTWSFDVYAGPKEHDALVAANPAYSEVIDHDLGFTTPIAKVLLAILHFFHWVTSSWGAAIILLTLSVRLVLFPINRSSQTAMARYQSKMKRIQPRIDEIKKRYEKDPSRLRQEQARIMQEEGAFPPLKGCFPPLLQIPVFIGLFRAIGVSFELRQTPFLGIFRDLSLPDGLLPLHGTLPFVGHFDSINLLPPIMVAMSIWQQRSMPQPTDEQAKTMYKMMMWMPIVMGFVLYNYAAGLSLYMITQSALGIFEQKIIRKYWPVDDKELPKQKKSGFLAKLMAAQEERMKQLDAQRRVKSRG